MGWSDGGTATREYAWLRLMSESKYDGYSDFRAGIRFVESLATWLQQFDPTDRQAAYDFIKNRLVYISPPEMQRLIEAFLPETVTPYLRRIAAARVGIKPYQVWGNADGKDNFDRLLRRTLFVGLSDGCRFDNLRRANAGVLSPEQIVPMISIADDKWEDLGENLKSDQNPEAKFEHVFLIDDFTASGTTLIRRVESVWKGKLKKFDNLVRDSRDSLGNAFPLAASFALQIHHYVSTAQARTTLERRVKLADEEWKDRSWGSVQISEGILLPESLKMIPETDDEMLSICETYYNHDLYRRLQKHCDEAGQKHMKFGYADCALPLCLEHNTPNNSISILWAETSGETGHPMRALFRRRDRHG